MKQVTQRRINSGQLWRDLLILGLLLIPLTYGLVNAQVNAERLIWTDGPWYLNRATLIERGIWPEFYVYTLGHPLLVSVIDRLTGGDLIAAGVIVNRLGTALFLIGTYLLGHLFFSRQVGLLAFLMTLCSVFIRNLNRLLHPFVLFYGLTTMTLIAFWFAIKRPGYLSAFVLGMFVNACLFTRFEGVSYVILILIAGFVVFRQAGWKLALKVVATGGITFMVGFGFYMSVLLTTADTSSGSAFTFLALLRQQPFPVDALVQRFLLTVQSQTFYWSPIILGVAVASAIWGIRRGWRTLGYVTCLLMLVVNFLNQFVLSIEPIYRQSGPIYPVVAVLFMDILIRLRNRFPVWRYLILIPILLVVLPEMFVLMRLSMRPAQDYRQFADYQAAQALDQYVQEANLDDREIYTFCYKVPVYSHSQLQVIYRLTFRDLDSPTWWNSPENLFARMAATGALYLDCEADDKPYLARDWREWYEGTLTTTYQLEQVGMVNGFELFEARTALSAND
jgi:hypothetical protein